MALTPNVVDGGIIMASWGNEVRDRTVQVFATVAERDLQWAAPPNGAQSITLDTGYRWSRLAGVWKLLTPYLLGYAQPIPGAQTVPNVFSDILGASVAVTALAGHRLRISGWANFVMTAGSGIVDFRIVTGAGTPVTTGAGVTVGAGGYAITSAMIVHIPGAGAITYKLQAKAPNAATLQFNNNVYMDVTDFGP